MGRVHSIQQLEVCAPSHLGEWTLIGRTDYCELLKNTDTGFEAEQYVVQADPNIPLIKTFEIYDYRRKQLDNLVQVYQVQNEPQSYICQGEDYLRVKTQRIPQRLSEVGILSKEQGVYILQQALIGYKTIFNFKGSVSINDDMIGFNKNGLVKVWLNNNFAKNYPDIDLNPPRYSENTFHASGITNQIGMIRQVVDVVQEHIDQTQFKQFLDLFYSISPKTFTETLHILKEYTTSRGIRILTGFRTNSIVINNARGTQRQIVIPSQKNILTQTQITPPITRSIQAPLQPYVIENYAPSAIVNYQHQPPTSYYIQQPIHEVPIVQQIITTQREPFVHPSNIITPRSTVITKNIPIIQFPSQIQVGNAPPQYYHSQIQQNHKIGHFPGVVQPLLHSPTQFAAPNCQIVENNTKIIANTTKNDIVSPFSQIRPNNSQNRVSPLRLNHRPSHPSTRLIQNQTQVSSTTNKSNIRSPQNKLISPPKTINQTDFRNHSPTIFRPAVTSQQKTSIPKKISSIVNATSPQNKIPISSAPITTKNATTNIVHPNSQLTNISHKKQQYRKSHVKEPHPTHNIGKTLHGVQRVNSIGDNLLDQLSPTLVTANPIKKRQHIIQNKTIISNPTHTTTVQQTQNISEFRGLPHRRSNINLPTNAVVTQAQIIQQNEQIINPKSSIMTQQTILDRLENNVNRAVFDFSTPTIKNLETNPNVFASFGLNEQFNNTSQRPIIQTNIRPARPHPQQNNIPSNIINYQPFQQYQQVIQQPIFEQKENTVNNISIIQHIGPITVGSGISTLINPLEQKPQVEEVVFVQVKSYAINDSVNPQIRKLMILPNAVIPHIHETNIIENIPIAESQHPEIIVQQTRFESNQQGNNLLQTEVNTKTNNANILQQNHLQRIVPKNGNLQQATFVRSNQTVSQGSTQFVNQTVNNQSSIKKKQGIDIESMMRQHEQQSKNLFMKYQEYGRSIQRQLPPNNPTSPSSLQKQSSPFVQPHSQRQQIIVVDYQPEPAQDQQLNHDIQTVEFQSHTQVNNQYNTQQIRIETNIIENFDPRVKPIIIHQEVIQNNQQPSHYQYHQQYNTIHNYGQIPNSRESPQYEYVTNDQYTNYHHQNPYSREDTQFQRQNIEESINFRQTTQSYNYDERAFDTIHHSRGTAPTYQQLRAALLETNLGLQQATRQQQYTEYKYETRQYD